VVGHDHLALVEHELGADAARLQEGGHRHRSGAALLLVVAEGEHHCAPGAEAALRQRLHRLQQADDRGLVVDRAPPPNVTVHERAGERRLVPGPFRPGRDGHHVLVRHETMGARAGSLPRQV
jgi:hypothetical protein